MRRQKGLFKNDSYAIKYKTFRWKLDLHIKKGIKVHTKILSKLLIIANKIGIPRTENDIELMRKIIKTYDETISKLGENLEYARKCVLENDDKE